MPRSYRPPVPGKRPEHAHPRKLNLENFLDDVNALDQLVERVNSGQDSIEQDQSAVERSLAGLSDPGSSYVAKSKQGSVGRQVIQAAAALDEYKLVLASRGQGDGVGSAKSALDDEHKEEVETLLEVVKAQEAKIQALEKAAVEEAKEALRSEAEKKLRRALAVQIREQITTEATMEMKELVVRQMSSQELEVLCFDFLEEKRAQLRADAQKQWQQKMVELDKMRADAEDRSKLKQAELSFRKQLNGAQAQHQRELAGRVAEEARLKKRLQEAEDEIARLREQTQTQAEREKVRAQMESESGRAQTRILEKEQAADSEELAGARKKISALQEEIAAANSRAEEAEKQLQALQQEYASLGEYICTLNQGGGDARDAGVQASAASVDLAVPSVQKREGLEEQLIVAEATPVKVATTRLQPGEKAGSTRRRTQAESAVLDLELAAELGRKYLQESPGEERKNSAPTSPALSVQIVHKDKRKTPPSNKAQGSQLLRNTQSPQEQSQLVQYTTPDFLPVAPKHIVKADERADDEVREVMLLLERENMQQSLFERQPPLQIAPQQHGELFFKSLEVLYKLWDDNEISYEHRNCFIAGLELGDVSRSLKRVGAELMKQRELADRISGVMKMIKRREERKTEGDSPQLLQEIMRQCVEIGPVLYRGINYLALLKAEGVM